MTNVGRVEFRQLQRSDFPTVAAWFDDEAVGVENAVGIDYLLAGEPIAWVYVLDRTQLSLRAWRSGRPPRAPASPTGTSLRRDWRRG